MENIMKIVKYHEESGLLIKCVGEVSENESKELKDEFLSMFLDIWAAGLLRNLLTGKGTIQADEGSSRVEQDF